MSEDRSLELEESITRTFLKTVSAFANYIDGRVVFGIDDRGKAVGVKDPKEDCIRIENMINDSIDPVPDYKIKQDTIDGKKIIILDVKKRFLYSLLL